MATKEWQPSDMMRRSDPSISLIQTGECLWYAPCVEPSTDDEDLDDQRYRQDRGNNPAPLDKLFR
jgi:hypothetical protein